MRQNLLFIFYLIEGNFCYFLLFSCNFIAKNFYSSKLTRAEFATMICRFMGYFQDKTCAFDDSKNHWATSYIRGCVDAGVINGFDSKTFLPDGKIQFEQAVKIIAMVSKKANGKEEYPNGL